MTSVQHPSRNLIRPSQSATVAILMATYQGEKYLEEQLDSIAKQTYSNWRLYVSDDGSSDKTMHILNSFKSRFRGKISVSQTQKNLGFAKNFMSLILDTSIKADYYAVSDQDDIWLPEKIERAVTRLTNPKNDIVPSLYFARTRLADDSGKAIGQSPLFTIAPSFSNALVQSLAGGNTCFFNHAAKNLLLSTTLKNSLIVSHDWWLYLIVSGCGGSVVYDAIPSILYRQHDNNLVGRNNSFIGKVNRVRRLLNGDFGDWVETNIVAIKPAKPFLTSESLALLEFFQSLRKGAIIERVRIVRKGYFLRANSIDNIFLAIAVILKKL